MVTTTRHKAATSTVRYEDADLGRPVEVKLRQLQDDRLEIVELRLLDVGRPITTDDLRRIPLGRIEAEANRATRTREAEGALRRIARTQTEPDVFASPRRRVSARIVAPTTRPYPDAFYERVAAVYRELAARGNRPAAEIAEASLTPVSTVHHWVKEARRRGCLPAGRPGKVG